MDISELFWSSSIEDIQKGYIYDKISDTYICLICGKRFEKGIIYPEDNILYEAEKYIQKHITKEHSSMFEYLINMNKKYTGLTDHQKELLFSLKSGLSDKEIALKFGGNSPSTVRNHRFKLREREKQAKIFLSIMGLLSDSTANTQTESKNNKLVEIHKSATMIDDRYAITENEKEKIIETYFNKENGQLKNFPTKEKRKIVVLQHIAQNFKANKKYSEKEINNIISRIYEDFVTIRRYLIEYGFMERYDDCSYYWLKE